MGWVNTQALDFRYNSFQHIGKIKGLSSGRLLYETCKDYPLVISEINKMYNEANGNKLVWRFKVHGDKIRLAIYKYQLEKQPSILSIDVNPDHPTLGDELHCYYNLHNKVSLPFWGYGTYVKDGKMFMEAKIFVLSSYTDFYTNYYTNYYNYMGKLDFSDIADKFLDVVLHKYDCYEICIHNKRKGQIFV